MKWKAVALALLVLGLYWRDLYRLGEDWAVDSNYSHGFLIPVVSAWLVWRSRDQLRAEKGRPWWPAAVVLVGGLALWVVGAAAAEDLTARVSIVAVLWSIPALLGGRTWGKILSFPALYLLFMIPWPYVLYYRVTFPLQLFSTAMATEALRTLGVHVIRTGNVMTLPNGYQLEVVAACSGLRSLLSLSALSAIFAYLTQREAWRRWFIFLLALPIAIVGNVVRLVVTALGAYLISVELAEGFLHEVSGLLLFVVGLGILFLAGGALNWLGKLSRSPQPS